MSSPENPYIKPDYEPSEEGVELARPKTYEDWVAESVELEAERDKIGAALLAQGIVPENDVDYNFLLGKLHTAREQAIAHAHVNMMQELSEGEV